MVVMAMPVRLSQIVSQLGIADRLCLLTKVGTSLIQGNRIKGSSHTDIWQNSSIILPMTITIWRNIHNHVDPSTR